MNQAVYMTRSKTGTINLYNKGRRLDVSDGCAKSASRGSVTKELRSVLAVSPDTIVELIGAEF